MSELESVNICACSSDGIKCNTEYSELIEEFALVHDVRDELTDDLTDELNGEVRDELQDSSQPEMCSEGVCPTNWKPERQNAA